MSARTPLGLNLRTLKALATSGLLVRSSSGVDAVDLAGGTTGQVLAKASVTDYDLEWIDSGAGGGSWPTWNPTALITNHTLVDDEARFVDLDAADEQVYVELPDSPTVGKISGIALITEGVTISTGGFTLTKSASGHDPTIGNAVNQTAYIKYEPIDVDGVQSQSVNLAIQNDSVSSGSKTLEIGWSQNTSAPLAGTVTTHATGTIAGENEVTISVNFGTGLNALVNDPSFDPADPIYLHAKITVQSGAQNFTMPGPASVSMTEIISTVYPATLERNGHLIAGEAIDPGNFLSAGQAWLGLYTGPDYGYIPLIDNRGE